MKKYKNYQKYNKRYFEIYAKKTLEYCYNNAWLNCFDVHKEKPDLQSELLDIGIEVTSSSSERERNITAIFNDYIAGNRNYKDLEIKIKKLGGNVCRKNKST